MSHWKCTQCSISIPLADVEDYQATKSCPFGRSECPFKSSDGLGKIACVVSSPGSVGNVVVVVVVVDVVVVVVIVLLVVWRECAPDLRGL
jgi:hypothetical protein